MKIAFITVQENKTCSVSCGEFYEVNGLSPEQAVSVKQLCEQAYMGGFNEARSAVYALMSDMKPDARR